MSQLLSSLSSLLKAKAGEDNTAPSPVNDPGSAPVRAIAFYLPQFHPIPENDEWWGKGFTEWTNVTKAEPLFEGHYQPRQPADLGYYDLRIADVRRAQAALAKKYGIHGFCYYHYWFGGKRLLERPFEEVLKSGDPDFPFCLCWANENWSRRWDGSESEVLMAQRYSDQDSKAFAEELIPAFQDKRYIRVDGKPLFLVYRPGIIPNVNKAIKIWRDIWRRAGIGEVYLVASLTFGDLDPIRYGFDAACEFPPHGNWTTNQLYAGMPIPGMTGGIYEYSEAVLTYMLREFPNYKLFRGVFPAWDNSARKGKNAHIFHNSTPEMYEFWLKNTIEQTRRRYQGDERIVFINAWNEWAEGAYLEPDRKHGHAYLAATKRALSGECNIDKVIGLFKQFLIRQDKGLAGLADDIERMVTERDNTIRILSTFARHNILSNDAYNLKPVINGEPKFIETHTAKAEIHCAIDNLHTGDAQTETIVNQRESLYIKAWAFCPSISGRGLTVVFKNMDGNDYHYANFYTNIRREDLAEHFSSYDVTVVQDSGVEGRIELKNLPCGKYQIGLAVKDNLHYALGWWPHPLIVE